MSCLSRCIFPLLCISAISSYTSATEITEGLAFGTSRRLLWDNSTDTGAIRIFIIIICIVVGVVVGLCKVCIKYGCQQEDDDRYVNAVVHPPPRTYNQNRRVAAPPTQQNFNSPSRLSTSIILPPEPGMHVGIDNPSYFPPVSGYPAAVTTPDVFQPIQPSHPGDMPPSYDAVVRGDARATNLPNYEFANKLTNTEYQKY